MVLRWVLGRLVSAAATLLGASILIFAAVREMPGNYAQLVLGPLASPEAKAAATHRYGLDRSVVEQYLLWLRNAVHGDLGTSLVSHLSVRHEVAERLPVTITITGLAVVLTIVIGIPLGIWTGVSARGGRSGLGGRVTSSVGISVPDFVLGSLVAYLFSRYSLGLSVGNYVPWSDGAVRSVESLLLPAAVLSVFCIAATARTTRDAVMSALVEPHVTAAVGRGESPWFIIRHHVLRNASIPVLTLVATLTAYLLGGAVIVEQLFNVPGLGSYLVQALGRRDYAVIEAGVLLAAVVFIAASLVIDLLSGWLDPRIAVGQQGGVR